jgi:PHD/YefM family antitoxin component YafN of YafNO toxin-antitoxin module
MRTGHERFVTDKDGKRVAVLLDMDEYAALLQELEELEAFKAYDAAKSTPDDAIPLDQALAEIEKDR